MRIVLYAALLLAAVATGIAVERFLTKDACLDLGGVMRGGVCRGVDV